MNIKEKLQLERADEKVIRLYHEGIFYTAYGYSAVRVKQALYPEVCLLEQKKKDGSSYFRIGIVQNSPALGDLPIKDRDGNFIPFLTVPYTGDIIDMDCVVPDRVIGPGHGQHKPAHPDYLPALPLSPAEQQVLDGIRSLDMASLTPLKAMQHILSWTEHLQRGDEAHGV